MDKKEQWEGNTIIGTGAVILGIIFLYGFSGSADILWLIPISMVFGLIILASYNN